jgi:hypothetical protein
LSFLEGCLRYDGSSWREDKGRGVVLTAGDKAINLSAVEPDANHIVLVTIVGNAATVRVAAKTGTGFTLSASTNTTVDWIIVR